jgi:formate dehydrogenase subunit delta
MHIERLITMANDIAAFFHSAANQNDVARSIAAHLRNYWDPRMRKQIIEHVQAGQAGLDAAAQQAVMLLAQDA